MTPQQIEQRCRQICSISGINPDRIVSGYKGVKPCRQWEMWKITVGRVREDVSDPYQEERKQAREYLKQVIFDTDRKKA